ncbi:MAG: hypothetical protein MSC43_00750 [Clostridiales bacterium]|nr:hypothetical protein [Clostridiales bacterium]MDD7432453.1 hypothetical protein [Clostridiales bacterium]MDY3061887.1 hypothetical protein [Eubacteriales bacterium]
MPQHPDPFLAAQRNPMRDFARSLFAEESKKPAPREENIASGAPPAGVSHSGGSFTEVSPSGVRRVRLQPKDTWFPEGESGEAGLEAELKPTALEADKAQRSEEIHSPWETQSSAEPQKRGEAQRPTAFQRAGEIQRTIKPLQPQLLGEAQRPTESLRPGSIQSSIQAQQLGKIQRPIEFQRSVESQRPGDVLSEGAGRRPDESKKEDRSSGLKRATDTHNAHDTHDTHDTQKAAGSAPILDSYSIRPENSDISKGMPLPSTAAKSSEGHGSERIKDSQNRPVASPSGLQMRPIKSGTLRPPFFVPRSNSSLESFADAVTFGRQSLPLPREMQLAQQQAHRTWLIAQINHCADKHALSEFAFSLNYRDLAVLFPALATLTRGAEVDRLISIIMMRASHYLYLQGWLTLQFAYPRSTVQKGLAELCHILARQTGNISPQESEQTEQWFKSLRLGPQRFDWPHLALISELSMPNTRHFLAAIIKYLQESKMPLEAFFQRYGIYPDLPLGIAIRNQWDMSEFERRINRPSVF